MATMTINVDDETAKRFREAVADTYGAGKGKLGKAVGEALDKWSEERRIASVRKRALAMLEKGIDFGGAKFNRKEFYDEVLRRKYRPLRS
ncbi:hypothetical protein KY362_00570 [Candidatus Woesearchaeota archaeon]|nr:hypothetical protein [Candidatus Woesearchaeota archaeon]